ncbi:MAG: hypothetical protein V4516_08320 [Pseudomonadota bacterium]
MFERLLEGVLRLAAFGEPFLRKSLLAFQLRDPLLVGRDHRLVRCFDDPVEQLFDLLLGGLDVRLENAGRLNRLRKSHIPRIPEHGLDQSEQGRCRLQALQHVFKLRFQLFPLD